MRPFSRPRGECAMTSRPWQPASEFPTNRPAIGCPPCTGLAHAACRSSFCAPALAGNVSKRFSAAGFPFARYGGSCPRWVVHTAFMQPGVVQVQVAELPDGAAYLCFARTVTRPATHWGEPRPVHVVAMGCSIAHTQELAYADRLGPAPCGTA